MDGIGVLRVTSTKTLRSPPLQTSQKAKRPGLSKGRINLVSNGVD